jgi:hypothetical protein
VPRRLTTGCIAFAVIATIAASAAWAAYGKPHWNYVEFVEDTQVGKVRVTLAVDTSATPRRLSKLEIRVNDRRLNIPKQVIEHVLDPQLDEVSVWRLGSVTCTGGADCFIAYPAELHVPYGPEHFREPDDEQCKRSELHIDFYADAVQSASYYVCNEVDDGQWQDLYQRETTR